MLPGDLYRIQAVAAQVQHHRQGEDYWAICAALQLYSRARCWSIWARVWSVLAGRSRSLLDLDAVRATGALTSGHHGGMRSVPIDLIRGTEGRCHDFDVGFWPLRSLCRERWVRIAAARLMRTPLPPVVLALVGDYYFVMDGHHRVSVARALGQTEIDAEITVYGFAGSLPWGPAVTADNVAFSRQAARA